VLALVEDALRLSDCILDHARVFLDLFDRRALDQQLDSDMAKLGLGRKTPCKSSLFESRREAREQWVRVWVPKEVWIREIERVLGRQLACRRVYARAPLMPQTRGTGSRSHAGLEERVGTSDPHGRWRS
jgi:hypothetical protein